MATMRDVARLAGVSTATVSRVLSGADTVSAHTKEIVLAAVRALEYEINITAKNLSTMKGDNIGIVIPRAFYDTKLFDEVYKMIHGISIKCSKNIIISECDDSLFSETKSLVQLDKKRCSLILYFPNKINNNDLNTLIGKINSPVLVINRLTERKPENCIWVDYFSSAYYVTNFLMESGTGDTIFLGDVANSSIDREIYQGFRSALKMKSCIENQHVVIDSVSDYSIVKQRVSEFSVDNSNLTAVVATSDESLLGLLQMIESQGGKKNSLRAVCFSEKNIPYLLDNGISVVEHPYRKMTKEIECKARQILAGDALSKAFAVSSPFTAASFYL